MHKQTTVKQTLVAQKMILAIYKNQCKGMQNQGASAHKQSIATTKRKCKTARNVVKKQTVTACTNYLKKLCKNEATNSQNSRERYAKPRSKSAHKYLQNRNTMQNCAERGKTVTPCTNYRKNCAKTKLSIHKIQGKGTQNQGSSAHK